MGKSGLHSEEKQVPRRKGRAGKKSLLRSRRNHERMSGCKSSPGRSAESWFHSMSDQTRNREEGWETKCLLIK